MPEILTGTAKEQAQTWLQAAGNAARHSACLRRKCGSVLVSEGGEIYAEDVNKLPRGAEVHCNPYQLGQGFKSDKACCVHAEQRSILQALQKGQKVEGSTMVFASVDDAGNRLQSGRPYCTICSKMALESGVKYWILEHAEGITRYEALEYNKLSFEYNGD